IQPSAVDVRADLRLLYGRRLHADSFGYFRKLWHSLAWQDSRPNHHGIFRWPVGRTVVGRQALRRPSQLRFRLETDCGSCGHRRRGHLHGSIFLANCRSQARRTVESAAKFSGTAFAGASNAVSTSTGARLSLLEAVALGPILQIERNLDRDGSL